jgi:ribosomal protein L37AE/L43A
VIPYERDPGSRGEFRRDDDLPFGRGRVDPIVRCSVPPPPGPTELRASRLHALAGWLVAPLCLAAVVAGTLLIFRGPDGLFGFTFGLVLALGLAWILACSLFPARADRTCPQCGRRSLSRLDRQATHGLKCRQCGWLDEDASSFLLAEDSGQPFEDIVLRERRPRRF